MSRRFWRMLLLSLFGLGLAGYGALCALIYARQDSMLYFPSPTIEVNPRDLGLEYEDFEIPVAEGTVTGWIVETDGPEAPWVIIFHGNAGNISSHIDHLPFFHSLGFNAVLFDYRGYGKSRGVPSEANLLEDGLAVRAYLLDKKRVPPEKLVYFGESLGGGVAAATAEKAAPAGLILKSTFTSVPDRGAQDFPFLPIRLLARTRLDTLSRVQRFEFPKLIMHGQEDEVISFSHGRKLWEKAREPKSWLEIPGTHNSRPQELGPGYKEAIRSFVLD